MQQLPATLKLAYNPFEPAATGAPLREAPLFIPNAVKQNTKSVIENLDTGLGVKAIVVLGKYGSGKTCFLRWLETAIFPSRRIRPFYFDNPGVQFYDLANRLLRTIGRKDFAKFIWELAGSHVEPLQRSLFASGYEEYLEAYQRSWRPGRGQSAIIPPLQNAIIAAEVTEDEQIAYCLARIVTEVIRQPYFEYRDFVPRQKGSVVPEGEEARYFRSVLKTIQTGMNARGTAFLIDEFEEIGLQKRLTKGAAYDYVATLKRLINLAQHESLEFWLVLSMTPDAYETTRRLDPALVDRMDENRISMQPLDWSDAGDLLASRLDPARPPGENTLPIPLYPFPDGPVLRQDTYSNPRRLVKVSFRAVAEATSDTPVPFRSEYLRRIEEELYPEAEKVEKNG